MYTSQTHFDVISVRNMVIMKTAAQKAKYVADAEITLTRKLSAEQLRIVSTVEKSTMPIPRIVIPGNKRRKFRGLNIQPTFPIQRPES
jgi:hypothetical protein